MPDSAPKKNDADAKLEPSEPSSAGGWRARLLSRHRWFGYVLPLVVFLVVTSFEPKPLADQPQTAEPSGWFAIDIPYAAYPMIYTVKLALSIAAIAFVWPVYRPFPFRIGWLSLVVGAIGVVVWVGLCHFGLERRVLPAIGLQSLLGSGQRSGFNPLVELAHQPALAYGFLAIRFVGLALVVPVIEEFFLRGFVMRLCVHEQWWNVPFGTVNMLAVVVGTAVPMAMHPAELVAALVWFSMITGLMVATRSIWDCVAAHAVTNLLLGIYVVYTGEWQLM